MTGGRFGHDLVKFIDGKPASTYHSTVRADGSNPRYPDVPQQSVRPRQPNDHQRYQTVEETSAVGEGLKSMDDVTPNQIYSIFVQRAESIDQAAILARRKIRQRQEKMLPEEMLEKVDQNREEIETKVPAILGHKQTIANAFHVYNGKDWESLRQVGEKFMKAMQEHDISSSSIYGYKFIVGVYSIMPSYLKIIEIYDELLPMSQENYELLLNIMAQDRAKMEMMRRQLEPKKIVNKMQERINALERENMELKAGVEPEEEGEEELEDVDGEEENEPEARSNEQKVSVKPPGVPYGRQPRGGRRG